MGICCSADGKIAISASSDKTLRVWDLETGLCKKVLSGHTGQVSDVCCILDGKFAFSVSDDNTLRVWDVTRGNCSQKC